VIVAFAVEDLVPVSGPREAGPITVDRRLAETDYDHDIAPHVRHPSVKGQHPIRLVHPVDGDRIGAQRRVPPPQPDHIPGEAVEVAHAAVPAAEAVPPDQQVRPAGVVGPQLSSRNSCPMNSIGTPGAVSSRPVATRARLRAYQDRGR
jgi:hypothetical protein